MFANAFVPCEIDGNVRARLSESLAYVFDKAGHLLDLDNDSVARALESIRCHRQAPGIFARYYDLVPAINAGDCGLASRLFSEIVAQTTDPVRFEVVAYDPITLGDDYERLARLVFSEFPGPNPMAPPPKATFISARNHLGDAKDAIRRIDGGIAGEIDSLLVRVVVATGSRAQDAQKFGGVTSFLTWGASFMNADAYGTFVGAVQFLVHEITHSLLLGLGCTEPLVINPPDENYRSPLRPDPRPMDGLYHATLVCARLLEFNAAWLDSGELGKEDHAKVTQLTSNLRPRFEDGLSVIRGHGELSGPGRHLLERSCRALAVAA
jgi:hypothetical protein